MYVLAGVLEALSHMKNRHQSNAIPATNHAETAEPSVPTQPFHPKDGAIDGREHTQTGAPIALEKQFKNIDESNW